MENARYHTPDNYKTSEVGMMRIRTEVNFLRGDDLFEFFIEQLTVGVHRCSFLIVSSLLSICSLTKRSSGLVLKIAFSNFAKSRRFDNLIESKNHAFRERTIAQKHVLL